MLRTTQLGHADIDDQQLWAKLLAEPRRLEAVGRFTHDRMTGVFEETAQPTAHDAVIVS
jgi:hypothetical protein